MAVQSHSVHSSISTGRLGTKKFSCSGVPLSRDKGRSKNPGTNSSLPGRPGTKQGQLQIWMEHSYHLCSCLSLDKNTTWLSKKKWKIGKKKNGNKKDPPFFSSVLGDGRGQLVKIRPFTVCVPSLGKILSLSSCPFDPGQWRNFCPFVPKSCTVPSCWKPKFAPPPLLGWNSKTGIAIICTADCKRKKYQICVPASFKHADFFQFWRNYDGVRTKKRIWCWFNHLACNFSNSEPTKYKVGWNSFCWSNFCTFYVLDLITDVYVICVKN